jgi:hypothetical protein
MANYLEQLRKEKRIYLKTLYDDIKARRDKDFFRPTGTQIYVGPQGSGKTISAVKHTRQIKNQYPRAILVSNLSLKGMTALHFSDKESLTAALSQMNPLEQYISFRDIDQLALALVQVNNKTFGVLYLIDEIHLYFNALESKNIPMYVFTEISQQRKQRKLIIGTSQLFLRAAKPLREQCDNVIVCKTFLGVLTLQLAYDGMSLDQDYSGKLTGNLKRRGWFVHTRELRDCYDTFQKVVSGADQYENFQRVEVSLTSKKNKITLK